ncbi:MAG: hypothetical protein ACRESK_10295, partial [Gammaproteobacteria bacterium]
MHEISIRIIAVAFFLAINSGCAASLSPMEVSEGFWKGVKERDNAAVARYVTSASLETLKQQDPAGKILPIKQFTLGRTVIEGDHAWIDTTVEVAEDRPFHMSVQTILQQENRQWKVDYNATVASISRDSDLGRVLGDIGTLSKQFTDKLNQSLDEAQKALPQIEREIGNIEEDLRQKLPELRQRMEELMRQLEEALGNKNRQEK